MSQPLRTWNCGNTCNPFTPAPRASIVWFSLDLTGSLLARLIVREGAVVVAVEAPAPALGVEAAVPLVLHLTSPAPNAEVVWRMMPSRYLFLCEGLA